MGLVNADDDLAMVHAILDAQEVPANASAAKRLVDFIQMVEENIDTLTDTAIKAMERIASVPRDMVNEVVGEAVAKAYGGVEGQLSLPGFEEIA